jgi:hypothetical protein
MELTIRESHLLPINATNKGDVSQTAEVIKGLGSTLLVGTSNLVQLLEDTLLSRPCPLCEHDTVYLAHCTQSFSPSFTFKCQNKTKNCKWKYIWNTSDKWCPPMDSRNYLVSEIPVKSVYSFLFSGLTYNNYEEVFNLLGCKAMDNKTFNRYCLNAESAVEEMVEELLKSNREMFQDSELWVTFDAGWSSRGWSANECTVVLFEARTGVLLDLEHVLRKLPGDCLGYFEGASCGMEGYGLQKMMERCKKENVNIVSMIHDRDNSAYDIVTKFYPNVKIFVPLY